MALRIFIVAGETSGDQNAAAIMRAIKKERPDVVFAGCSGPEMRKQGINSVMHIEVFALFGIVNVLMSYFSLIKKINDLAEKANRFKPDIILTIDSPDLSTRFIQRLDKNIGYRIHIGLPSVWFWRSKRIILFQNLYNMLLAFFPFDVPLFKNSKTKCHFIGHTVFENTDLWQANGSIFRKKYNFLPDQKLLCVLPGSRRSEVKIMSPIFIDVIKKLRQNLPDISVIIPIAPGMQEKVKAQFGSMDSVLFIENAKEKYAAMKACNATLAASGTVNLELMACKSPHIVAHKILWLSKIIIIAIRKINRETTPYTTLGNYMAQSMVIPEHTLKGCHSHKISRDLIKLFTSNAATKQIKAFDKILKKFLYDKQQNIFPSPSKMAAKYILSFDKKTDQNN